MRRTAELAKETSARTAVAEMDGIETRDRQHTLGLNNRPAKSGVPTNPSHAIKNTSQNIEERRQQRRVRMSLPVRLRSATSKDGSFSQVVGTVNWCRNGLYFTTTSKEFYERMRLRVVFPYNSVHDSVSPLEDYAEVVRLDHLSDGRLGIAVLIGKHPNPTRSLAADKTPKSHVPEPMDRRDNNRYPFSAAATICERESRVCLRARCSDLSVAGCYIDTINPFPETASVQVRLSSGQENLEIVADVCFSQSGMGMGLSFCKMTPEQELILIEWLNQGAVEPTPRVERPENSDSPDSQDRTLTLRLIRLLRSKGSLTEADISVLLSDHDVSDEELSCRPCADRL